MAYREDYAQVLRKALARTQGISERKMFGGLCFMMNGNMLCGVHQDGGMARVGKELEATALDFEGVDPLSFTGRKMGGMVELSVTAFEDSATLKAVLRLAKRYVKSLPTKPAKKAAASERARPKAVAKVKGKLSGSSSSAEAKSKSKSKSKVAKLPTGKSSALADGTDEAREVDAYIEGLEDPFRAIARELHALLMAWVPRATASIKWSRPVYELEGAFAFFSAGKKHVTFGFWRGTDLDDELGLLEGTGKNLRHIKVKRLQDIRKAAFKKLVKQAVRLNREKSAGH